MWRSLCSAGTVKSTTWAEQKVSSDWRGALVTPFSRQLLSIQEDILVRCTSSICCQRKQTPSHIAWLVLDFLVLFSFRVVLSKYFTCDVHTEDHKKKWCRTSSLSALKSSPLMINEHYFQDQKQGNGKINSRWQSGSDTRQMAILRNKSDLLNMDLHILCTEVSKGTVLSHATSKYI